jgi:hypothetical protein
MNTDKTKEKKLILSTLWIFVTANYIFCDVVTLMNPSDLKQILTGMVGNIQMNQQFLLGAAIMMEIPFAMILFSRVLKYKANKLANICAGLIMTLVQISSLFAGSGLTLHYIFYSAIEIVCTLFIACYAFKWKETETTNN